MSSPALGQTNPLHRPRPGSALLGSSSAGKIWESWWTQAKYETAGTPGTKASQQHPGLYYINRTIASKIMEVIVHLYLALTKPHLDTVSTFGASVQERHWEP